MRNSPHRHKPLPEVHNVTPKQVDGKSDRGTIWTPPDEKSVSTPAEIAPSPSLSNKSLSPTGKALPTTTAAAPTKHKGMNQH